MNVRKSFTIFWLLSIFGHLAVLPYLWQMSNVPLTPTILVMSTVQTAVLSAILVILGLLCARKIEFNIGFAKGNKLPQIGLMILLAAILGVAIYTLDTFVFRLSETIEFPNPAFYLKVLASLYGGINEELYMRLFLVSAIVWMLSKLFKSKTIKPAIVWVAIIFSALAFGAGHLPAMAQLAELTPIVITRTLCLNGIGGIVFGWIYWRKGLLNAMLCHGMTDIVLALFP